MILEHIDQSKLVGTLDRKALDALRAAGEVLNGHFTEAGAITGIDLPTKGRGALVTDFNMDSRPDLLVISREQPASLFRNMGARTETGSRGPGNFIAVELRQDDANRDAVGAVINVKCGNET